MRFSRCFVLLFFFGSFLGNGKAEEWDVDRLTTQMRWPFSDQVRWTMDSSPDSYRFIEGVVAERDIAQYQSAADLLGSLIAAKPALEDVSSILTPEGVSSYRQSSPERKRIFQIRDLVYDHALLYALTGDKKSLQAAEKILLDLSQLMPGWPLFDREGNRHSQSSASYLKQWDASGLWGQWFPMDLKESLPLLRAYDILRPDLDPAVRQAVEEGLFGHHKALLDRYNFELFSNLSGYHLIPLVRFARVLNRPEWMHQAVEYWRQLLYSAYTPDGFFRELTPSYHLQLSRYMTRHFPDVVKGYTDPPGYVSAKGVRFDELDLRASYGSLLEQIDKAVEATALPNGFYAALNDAWPNKDKTSQSQQSTEQPALLGVAGLAKLGTSGLVAMLQFGGLRGHDHLDALNLVWYAGKREVFSETGYQPLAGSDSTREWHTVTASHNTVAVDGKSHFQNRQATEVQSPRWPLFSFPPNPPGQQVVEAAIPGAARYANQGRLLLWHARQSEAQAMEAEQEYAYPGVTQLFRRTIVMVPLGREEGYLLDLFRIRGGRQHDFFLRGGLDFAYALQFDGAISKAKDTLYSYINVTGQAQPKPPFSISAIYPDEFQVRSTLLGLTPESNRLRVFFGQVPAIRRDASADIAVVRSQSSGASTFAWLHHAFYKDSPSITTEFHQVNHFAIVTVTHPDGVDIVFSSDDENARLQWKDWEFSGKLAWVRQRDGERKGIVFRGNQLKYRQQIIAEGNRMISGRVVATTRREAGDPLDSLLLEGGQKNLPEFSAYSLVHIDFGYGIRSSIPIKRVTQEDGMIRVELTHSPGFFPEGQTAIMTSLPGWRIQQEPKATLQ